MSSIWRKTNRDRKDVFRDVGDLLDAAGALDWLGLPSAPVMLKPNLILSQPASGGATTTPSVTEGLIRYLRDGGYERIIIGEGSWVGDSTSRAFRVCGYEELADKYGIPLIDLQKDESVTRMTEDGPFKICRSVAELEDEGGSLINLPLVKGHGQTGITCALKNLKGCIPDSEKRRYHSLGVHRPVARLNTLIRPAFALVDGLNPDPGWEEGGNPEKRDLLLLGKDPVAMDSYAARLLGVPEEDVRYIGMAEALGIGSGHTADEDIIDLDGRTGDAGMDRPSGRDERKELIRQIVDQRSACSSCFGHLAMALRERESLEGGIARSICIGQEFRGSRLSPDVLGIGSCTKGDFCLGGCPPSVESIRAFLSGHEEKWLK